VVFDSEFALIHPARLAADTITITQLAESHVAATVVADEA